jgi:hypothetical protein
MLAGCACEKVQPLSICIPLGGPCSTGRRVDERDDSEVRHAIDRGHHGDHLLVKLTEDGILFRPRYFKPALQSARPWVDPP